MRVAGRRSRALWLVVLVVLAIALLGVDARTRVVDTTADEESGAISADAAVDAAKSSVPPRTADEEVEEAEANLTPTVVPSKQTPSPTPTKATKTPTKTTAAPLPSDDDTLVSSDDSSADSSSSSASSNDSESTPEPETTETRGPDMTMPKLPDISAEKLTGDDGTVLRGSSSGGLDKTIVLIIVGGVACIGALVLVVSRRISKESRTADDVL
ncbi:hypothetical protein Poli38472_001668 [Pythium oligandrum]|uniref:Mucin-like protein n=1 Tax=Pythium oligandrum TaxID=41045 RepID=A0A8K1FRZ6_PYTOL|nr:hypothetical protein Poli38472_001668 [Pythium oligandrum]|eukprot:TMW69512.1 hypothetical protein Poli38472_001668 [Pythium oligandrum]